MVHDNSNRIRMISPVLVGDDGYDHSAESVIAEDALKAPEIWLKDAAVHMKGAAIGGNLVMTQWVCLWLYIIYSLFTHPSIHSLWNI